MRKRTSEPAFVQRMREGILKDTGQEIDADDPIYPLLACVQIMSRSIARELRAEDEKALRALAKESARQIGEQGRAFEALIAESREGFDRIRDSETERFGALFRGMKTRIEGVEREVYARSTEKFKLGVFCGSLLGLGCVSGFILARFLF